MATHQKLGDLAEELEAQGIEDFQLHYAAETLRRTMPKAVAQRRK